MQVLYVDVVHDEGLAQLQSVSAAIATKFREADLLGHEEGQEFTAHLTVAKLSALRRQGNRRRSAVKKLPQVLCPAHFGHVLSVICCGQNNGSTLQIPPPLILDMAVPLLLANSAIYRYASGQPRS